MQKRLPQSGGSIDLGAIPQFDGGVDGSSTVTTLLGSPLCVGIKVFQRETDRVHEFVATGTRLIFPVYRHLLTQCENFLRPGDTVLQRRNVRWRFRRRGAEDVFQNPYASLDRRSPEILDPGDRQEAPLSQ